MLPPVHSPYFVIDDHATDRGLRAVIPVLEHKLCDWTSRALAALFPPPSYDDFTEAELRDLHFRND